ncbi:MAG: YicC family protein [Verrucomicrobiota bacterium]|nr:YicC family protein [Verrucomicrobiota bacterium]
MKSMTGYGRATAAMGSHTVTVQVSSVNRKAFDLTTSLPTEWESLEPAVAELTRKFAVRGKVHVDIELSGANGAEPPGWDEAAANAALDRLAALAARRGVPFSVTPELLWQVANSQRKTSAPPPLEESRPVVLAALNEALQKFAAMRAQEGAALLKDFQARLALLKSHLSAVTERAPRVTPAYREQLLKRLREAGLELDLNDERVLKEIAFFSDRCDVSEELTRLQSHFEQFVALLHSENEIGRKAEFILQEIGREVHTVGSKANDLEISRSVIELKNELERVREQMANVE